MDEQLKRRSIYFVLILIAGIAGYKYFAEYKAVKQSDRFTDYMEGRKNKLNGTEAAYVKQFYDKFCKLYTLIESDTSKTNITSKIERNILGKGFELRVCTSEFLDFICNPPLVSSPGNTGKTDYYNDTILHGKNKVLQNLNMYMGNGDFTYEFANRKWHGGVLNEIRNFEKDGYLMVIVTKKLIEPEYVANSETFYKGSFKGKLYVLDVNASKIMAVQTIYAENDESIKSIPLKDYAMNEKLIKNLEKNIFSTVSKSALSILGKPLQALDSKVQGIEP